MFTILLMNQAYAMALKMQKQDQHIRTIFACQRLLVNNRFRSRAIIFLKFQILLFGSKYLVIDVRIAIANKQVYSVLLHKI